MIILEHGFFDSVDPVGSEPGDERYYNAGQVCSPFKYLVSNGVYRGGENLRVVPNAQGLPQTVAINPGWMWAEGHFGLLKDDGAGGDTEYLLAIPEAGIYPRIDRIVMRLDVNFALNGRFFKPVLLQGTPSATPEPPEITRTNEVHDMSLAQIYVNLGGAHIIPKTAITDERFDADLCGIAQFAPQPDLTPVIEEFTANAKKDANAFNAVLQQFIEELGANGLAASLVSTVPPAKHPDWTTAQKYFEGVADKSVAIAFNLPANGWTGSAEPYTQVITVSGVDARANGTVGIADTATKAERDAARGAGLWARITGTNTVTVYADNGKPSINLPCALLIVG